MADKSTTPQATRHFEAGETIIRSGSYGRGLYVLLRGKLEVMRDDISIATISQKGSFVGEISAILGCPCTATVKALSASELMYIEKVTEYLEDNPQASYVLAQTMARRIMDMNKKFIALEQLLQKLQKGEGREVGSAAAEQLHGAITEIQDLVNTDSAPQKRKPGWS